MCVCRLARSECYLSNVSGDLFIQLLKLGCQESSLHPYARDGSSIDLSAMGSTLARSAAQSQIFVGSVSPFVRLANGRRLLENAWTTMRVLKPVELFVYSRVSSPI